MKWNDLAPVAVVVDSLSKCDPRVQLRNPLTLGVYVGAIFTTILGATAVFGAIHVVARPLLVLEIAAWLWLSILYANCVEGVVERRGRARAAKLRSTLRHVDAKKLLGRNRAEYRIVEAGDLRRGDTVLVEASELIPADGTVIEGAASVSEGAVTGESAPVLRAAGRNMSSVRGGTRVLTDWLVVRVRSREGFFDPMIGASEGTVRFATQSEIALAWLIAAATLVFLFGVATGAALPQVTTAGPGEVFALTLLVALLVSAVPIATRALLATMVGAAMDGLMRSNVIVTSSAAAEAAGEVDRLLIDKTGTVTFGDRHAVGFHSVAGTQTEDLVNAAWLASVVDETPEGRSIAALASGMLPERPEVNTSSVHEFHAFSARTRISGVDVDGRKLRKGATEAVRHFVEEAGGHWPSAVNEIVETVARSGATPLVVADGSQVLGVIELRDVIKDGIRASCTELRKMGITTVMVTGDHRLTAMAIAAEIGVDDFLADATPQRKLELVRRIRAEGHRVAMCGDGTNDAPALAQADVAIVMNIGTPLAKDAGDIVDLDSDPNHFVEIVKSGRQMRETRRRLTTFSIALDLAMYGVVLGAVVAAIFPPLNVLNVMRLASPFSAVLSTVIFSALLIVLLILFGLQGLRRSALGALALPGPNWYLYALGGVVIPFVGIKAVDMGLVLMHLV